MADIILLNDVQYDGVINMPVFKINQLYPSINLKEYDGLIFTSKNAIKALDAIDKSWIELDSYCIAPKTASVVKKYKGNVVFTGKQSHGNAFAQELVSLLKAKKVLYIRASKTVSNLTEILKKSGVDIGELIVYETVCNDVKFQQPEKDSTIIFTSPSSVECYFKNYQWNSSYKAIVIGKTTASYMPDNIEFFISETQSVDSCINLALTL